MENKTALAHQRKAWEELTLAIKSLPEEQRQAFVMRDAMNMEYSDIAEVIGIAEEDVRSLVTRARGSVADFTEESASEA